MEKFLVDKERIAKKIARAGLGSRREVERWIKNGRVAVDGVTINTPVIFVNDKNTVTVDGRSLPEADQVRLWRYHKPVGLITTQNDPEGRRTIFDDLQKDMPRVISVGRLDVSSEGLILLTNDGNLARRLEHPEEGWRRRYRVRVHGYVTDKKLQFLSEGITIGGIHYKPIKAYLERQQRSNAWVNVTLTEGKNREIRHVMSHFDWSVTRLIRVEYGPFSIGTLRASEIDEVSPSTLRDNNLLGGK